MAIDGIFVSPFSVPRISVCVAFSAIPTSFETDGAAMYITCGRNDRIWRAQQIIFRSGNHQGGKISRASHAEHKLEHLDPEFHQTTDRIDSMWAWASGEAHRCWPHHPRNISACSRRQSGCLKF